MTRTMVEPCGAGVDLDGGPHHPGQTFAASSSRSPSGPATRALVRRLHRAADPKHAAEDK